nr:formylglycine-generating enzyme family protein [Anaerolineae bacterium]
MRKARRAQFVLLVSVLSACTSIPSDATPTVALEPTMTSAIISVPELAPTLEPASTSTAHPTSIPEQGATAAPTLNPNPLGYAGNPITSNDQWEPLIQEFDGVPMALVPAGCFTMGSTDEQVNYAMELYGPGAQRGRFANEQPAHEVCFDEPFWIDIYEVTNGQIGSNPNCTAFSYRDSQPRICINSYNAQAYCETRGGRLPTEAEWEYAARGPDSLIFTWGNEFVTENVAFLADGTWDVGSRPGGISWIGAYDMGGNVWEWVSDWYNSYPSEGQQARHPGDNNMEVRVVRGGSSDHLYGVRAAFRGCLRANISQINYGFRCAREYTP